MQVRLALLGCIVKLKKIIQLYMIAAYMHTQLSAVAAKMKTKFVFSLFHSVLLLASVVSGFTPVTYPARVSSECGQYDPALQDEQFTETLGQIKQQLSPPGCNPLKNRTCQTILNCFPSSPSGNYQITASNGLPVQAYCDMEGTNCGGEGGWMRVAYINMAQSGATCPQGLTQRFLSGKNYCGRNIIGCQSTYFSTHGLSYSRVCGRLRGYQYGGPDAFNAGITNQYTSVDSNYVDGASITYGSNPRKHVWTYASGVVSYSSMYPHVCPCNSGSPYQAPSFIDSNYYCESGVGSGFQSVTVHNDPLWDGHQCPGLEAPCCTHHNMPWFIKTLSQTTTENIELRLCGDDSPTADEDVPIELIELYIR